MYSNLSLYYLNQLGIKPWINKEAYYNARQQTDLLDHQTVAVVVFCSSSIGGKAELLLKRIIAFLAIEQEKLLSIKLGEADLFNLQKASWYSLLQGQRPQAILSFGLNPVDLIEGLKISCPLYTSFDPELLMRHASDKKKAFQELVKIKQILDKQG